MSVKIRYSFSRGQRRGRQILPWAGRTHDPQAAHTKLLIVDDDELIAQEMARHFTLKGYNVRAVCGGEEALALAPAFQPNVILLNLLMPGMSSLDVLKALKQLTPAPKVVMLGTANHVDIVKGTLSLGADFYLCKPIHLSEIERLVHTCTAPPTGQPA